MVSKALKIALISGLISALLVPVSYFIYGELTITDPVVKQYNGFSLLAGIMYIPFTFVFGLLVSLALLKTKLSQRSITAIVTLAGTAGVSIFFFFSDLFV